MAYVRRKSLKGHDYYYLVESYRQEGKVKTRTLKKAVKGRIST